MSLLGRSRQQARAIERARTAGRGELAVSKSTGPALQDAERRRVLRDSIRVRAGGALRPKFIAPRSLRE